MTHKPHAELISECLRCMSILGTHGQIRLYISRTKGVKRILSALDRHPMDMNVQEGGSRMCVMINVSTA